MMGELWSLCRKEGMALQGWLWVKYGEGNVDFVVIQVVA